MTVDDFAPLPGPGIVAGDELLTADQDTVRGFASAVVAAQEQIAADPERGVEASIAEVPAIADDRETALAVLEATVEAWDPPVTGQVAQDVWQMGYETMQRLGFIDGSVPVQDMYDASVME
jgi:ABC-type nitrate/sulfonate/bicarbonate transport system substrate-binding protein